MTESLIFLPFESSVILVYFFVLNFKTNFTVILSESYLQIFKTKRSIINITVSNRFLVKNILKLVPL